MGFAWAGQAAAAPGAECRVHAIKLEREGSGTIPAELNFIRAQLESDIFAAYKSYELVDAKSMTLKLGEVQTGRLKTGHTLELEFKGQEAGKLKLGLSLLQGQKKLLGTTYRVAPSFPAMVGNVRYQGGKLVFAVQCKG
jgi:hypothetical protein